ncbi:hypothetical protein Tco_0280239, partial [Tanacetum coccineum]
VRKGWRGCLQARASKRAKQGSQYISCIQLEKVLCRRTISRSVEIMDREVKRLKRSRILLVKVRWNSKRGLEFTWEREDQFKKKYPHLFTKTAPSSTAAS